MIEKGKNHLIYEASTNFTFELFAEFDKSGTPCICLTTKMPKKIQKEYNLKQANFFWLSDPDDAKKLKEKVQKTLKEFVVDNDGAIILIDEVDYLILENGYEAVEKFLVDLGKIATKNNATLIVPLNPGAVTEEVKNALARKFDQIKDVRNIILTGNKVECPECGAMWHTNIPVCDICGYEFTQPADKVAKPALDTEERQIPKRPAKITGKLRTKASEEEQREKILDAGKALLSSLHETEPEVKVAVPKPVPTPERKQETYDYNNRPIDDSWFNRGVALEKMGKSEQAIECFDSALDENPNDSWAWFNKGVSLHRLGLLGEALYCYDKALSLSPNDPDIMSNKGILLRTLGKTDEALACYRKALEINPRDAGIWSNLGVTYRVLGMTKEALESYDQALQIDKYDVGVWLNKAAALQSEGRFDEAIQCYEEVLKINPYHPVALRNKEFAMGRTLRS
jgi:tetratricopeptide (TPR) repeat protein